MKPVPTDRAAASWQDAALHPDDIAITGMAVDLPGSAGIGAYWKNLRDGLEAIRVLDRESLLAAGERPETLAQPNYVPSAALLDGYDHFDAEFFGFSPREAAILDPQHRKFLEVAWGALEDAAHTPESLGGRVGVYAGCGMGSYFYFNLCSNPALVDDVGMFLLRHTGNDKDFLSTRVSHVFDLTGPSVNVQTACSTSLVAIHYAAEALRKGECDMALAGGVTIELPQGRGYLYRENEILSPDGHCHAFDHRAQGTVFGSGAGAVALRRLGDAIADGDHIWAVLKGSAINNDGAAKAGYLAPSVEGQAAAVRAALEAARVSPDSIDYVECHGTGTYIGDPIEVAALSEAFRDGTARRGYCRIGSVKTNIGHLDTAAGVAGFVKTALALKHGEIPPSLGYEKPNPAIDFVQSPFRVNDRLSPWAGSSDDARDASHTPRRASVNALGVGGTNAHAILEEAPALPPSGPAEFPFQVLCVSGQTKAALEANTQALAEWLRDNPQADLADVAFTLKEGRRGFARRRVVVAQDPTEAADLLEGTHPHRVFSHERLGDTPEAVFMFPGGGAQYVGMARDLYETEPVFAQWMDRGLDHLAQAEGGADLRALWLAPQDQKAAAEQALLRPSVQLPLIMMVEYALARLWMSWGVTPTALVGHSMGENTAACLAGVIGFEDCIDLVRLRGQLFDTVPAGGMVSVSLPQAETEALIGDTLDIASVNGAALTVVSGPQEALEALCARLQEQDVDFQRIAIDIAAHSRMLDPILARYRTFLEGLTLRAPQMQILSNRSGQPLTAQEATSPQYWVDQLRNTVRFADCMATLAQTGGRIYLEVGPGRALSALARHTPAIAPTQVISSLRHPDHEIGDDMWFLGAIGQLWACGLEADWGQIWGETRRQRLSLPTYAFQRSRYFIAPGQQAAQPNEAPLPRRHDAIRDWGYRPVWRARAADLPVDAETDLRANPQRWLLFQDEDGLAEACAARLRALGQKVVCLRAGDTYARLAPDLYQLAPEEGRIGYETLLADLAEADQLPDRIGHFWLLSGRERFRPGSSVFDRNVEMGFQSLLHLMQGLAQTDIGADRPLHISVLSNGAQQVDREALPWPEKALVAGPVGVGGRELPGISLSWCDIELPRPPAGLRGWIQSFDPTPPPLELPQALCTRALRELLIPAPRHGSKAPVAAWRGDMRYEQHYQPLPLDAEATRHDDALAGQAEQDLARLSLPSGAHYLITGGLGGMGRVLAEHLLATRDARVTLVGLTPLPGRAQWPAYLHRHAAHDRTAQRIRALMALEARYPDRIAVQSGDVSNLEHMRRVRTLAQRQFGPVAALLHAAGQIADAPILAKTDAQVAQVLTPKVSGLRVLEQVFLATDELAPDLLVLFASSSTATRPAGQVDYVAANAYLNAYACSKTARPQASRTRVVALNWGIWADAGMAADAQGQSPQSVQIAHEARGPLWQNWGHDLNGDIVFRGVFDPASDWILNEHRTRAGQAVMPGTGMIELIAEALAELDIESPYTISDLYFLQAFDVADTPAGGAQAVMHLREIRQEGRACGYEIALHRAQDERSDNYVPIMEARILHGELARYAAHAAPLDLAALRATLPKVREGSATGPERLRSPQEAHLRFGPRWHVLRSTRLGEGEGLAELVLPEIAAQDRTLLHPALMDLATGWAIELAKDYDPGALWVPLSYDAITVHAPLGREILSHMRRHKEEIPGAQADVDSAVFDVTLCDAEGRILVEVSAFRMQRLSGGFDLQPTRTGSSAAALGLAVKTAPLQLSAQEARLRSMLGAGIRAQEGPSALSAALHSAARLDLAEIVVSALDLGELIEDADTPAPTTGDGTQEGFERPDLDSDFVAPEGALEQELAQQFARLLGLAQVGAQDSFFDLGGHSLIAVRLFAQIKRSYGIEFPLSLLFEAPTVAALARRIEAAGAGKTSGTGRNAGTGGNGDADTQHEPRNPPQTHLVPLHPGPAHSAAEPLFIVAGMFGNVLNLRQLAQIIGQDRPVYGLQARGLIGGDQPHETLTEAAADCIAELRQIQPQGPYRLAGFSGGGLTAYEMAQQMNAAGDRVATLALLDTPLPQRPSLSRRDKALIRLQEFRDKGAAHLGEWARARIAWEITKRRGLPGLGDQEGGFNNRRIEAAFRRAIAVYAPKPWAGEITLYRPVLDRRWQVSGNRWVSSAREYVYDDNDWGRFAPRLEVIEVPGDHDGMVLMPSVTTLGAHMRALLSSPLATGYDRQPQTAQSEAAE